MLAAGLPLASSAQPIACVNGNNGDLIHLFCCRGCDIVATAPIEGLAWSFGTAGLVPGTVVGGPYFVGPRHGTVIYTDAPAVGLRQLEANPVWFALPGAAVSHLVSDLSDWLSDELEILTEGGFVVLNPENPVDFPPCADDSMGVLPLTPPVDFIEVYGPFTPNFRSRVALIVDANAIYRVVGGFVNDGEPANAINRPGGAFVNATKNNYTVTLNFAGGSVAVDLALTCIPGFKSAVFPTAAVPTPIAGMPAIGCAPAPAAPLQLAQEPLLRSEPRAGFDLRKDLLRAGLDRLAFGSRPAWAAPTTVVNMGGGPSSAPQAPSYSPDGIVFLGLLMLGVLVFHRLRVARG